jgi:hypothetical protein
MSHLDWSKPVSSLLYRLQEKGFTLISVFDGEETTTLVNNNPIHRRKEATEIITSVDESWVTVGYKEDRADLYLVLGNGPDEILADYSYCPDTELEALLEEVEDQFSRAWENKKVPVVA